MRLQITSQIDGLFRGFNEDSIFKLTNGQVCQQKENKHIYHYAFKPQGYVIQGIKGFQLQIKEMNEPVRVKRGQIYILFVVSDIVERLFNYVLIFCNSSSIVVIRS